LFLFFANPFGWAFFCGMNRPGEILLNDVLRTLDEVADPKGNYLLHTVGFITYAQKANREQEEEFKAEWEWLNSWDVFSNLLSQEVDFVTCENCFGQVRGTKVGGKIADKLKMTTHEPRQRFLPCLLTGRSERESHTPYCCNWPGCWLYC
jgi:hypothetical protein